MNKENDMVGLITEFNDSQELTISIIPASLVQTVWDPIETLLRDIVVKVPTEINPNIVYNNLVEGKMLLVTISDKDRIIAFNGLDTRTTETGFKYLMIPLTSGTRLDEWMPTFLELAKLIGKERGCREIRGMAIRDGWLRKLKSVGWTTVHTTIKCNIT